MKLLEIGKIVRPHGIAGAVKIIGYLDEGFKGIHNIFIGQKLIKGIITACKPLNNDAYSLNIDVIKDVDMAENFRNQSIYIDREQYKEFKDKIYMSDLIGKRVLNEKGEQIGELVDFDDYGASTILTIKTGAVSYQIPFVDAIIIYNEELDCFLINQQKFEDLRV